jgi:hypothetical protein
MRGRPGLALNYMPRQPPLRLLRSGEPSRLQSTPTGRRRTQNSGGNKRSRNDSCAARAETSNWRRRFNPASGWRRIRVVLAEDSPGRTSPARPLGEAVRSLGAFAPPSDRQAPPLRTRRPTGLRGIVQSPTRFQVSTTVCITIHYPAPPQPPPFRQTRQHPLCQGGASIVCAAKPPLPSRGGNGPAWSRGRGDVIESA